MLVEILGTMAQGLIYITYIIYTAGTFVYAWRTLQEEVRTLPAFIKMAVIAFWPVIFYLASTADTLERY